MPSAVLKSAPTTTSDEDPFRAALLQACRSVRAQHSRIALPYNIRVDVSVEKHTLLIVKVESNGIVQIREVEDNISVIFGVHGYAPNASTHSKQQENFRHCNEIYMQEYKISLNALQLTVSACLGIFHEEEPSRTGTGEP
jgi:hypothetical protein